MRVLLDENLDQRLRVALSEHEVFTVAFLGWSGLKNGNLLGAAEEHQFDVLVTGDQTLSAEQNLEGRGLAVVVLSAVEWPIVKHHVDRISAAIRAAQPGQATEVECGRFTRRANLP